jgi:hypothetical protein
MEILDNFYKSVFYFNCADCYVVKKLTNRLSLPKKKPTGDKYGISGKHYQVESGIEQNNEDTGEDSRGQSSSVLKGEYFAEDTFQRLRQCFLHVLWLRTF